MLTRNRRRAVSREKSQESAKVPTKEQKIQEPAAVKEDKEIERPRKRKLKEADIEE
jgi:hypothetical protein